MIKALITIIIMAISTISYAQDENISGYMFGDYYWIAANHDSTIEDQNGFWLRRIYFTFDKGLSEDYAVRLRLEMASPGGFSKSGKLTPVVKDAYLQRKFSGHKVLLGISSTPTWSVVEKKWGYRSVEKTPLDLQKFGGSRDFGISFKGNLGEESGMYYHFMFANGEGNKSETNKNKKFYLSVGYEPTESITLEAYIDREDRPDDADRTTVQGFASYEIESARMGILFAKQNRKGDPDLNLEILSLFGVLKLSEKVKAFGRLDRMFDPNPAGSKISYIPFDNTAKSKLIIAGLDLSPEKGIHFMPNVELVIYDELNGIKPDKDVIPRFTFYYKWK